MEYNHDTPHIGRKKDFPTNPSLHNQNALRVAVVLALWESSTRDWVQTYTTTYLHKMQCQEIQNHLQSKIAYMHFLPFGRLFYLC